MQEAVARIVNPLLPGLERALGASYSAVLYGSAARGEWHPDGSDVNLLLVCDTLRPEVLRRLGPVLEPLRASRQPPPLLEERGEWSRAVDVFPIEIADMQLAHETLRGPDPVAGLRVDLGDLRRALEQELRGKLLRLRQVFAAHSGEPAVLGAAAAQSVGSVAALLRVSLLLHGQAVPPATPECLAAAGAALGIHTAAVAELWHTRRRDSVSCAPELFEGYLATLGAAVHVIDQFTPGGN